MHTSEETLNLERLTGPRGQAGRSPARQFARQIRRFGFLPTVHFVQRYQERARARGSKLDPGTFLSRFFQAQHYRQTRPGYHTRFAVVDDVPIAYRMGGPRGKHVVLVTAYDPGQLPPVEPTAPPQRETCPLCESRLLGELEREQVTLLAADSPVVRRVVPAHTSIVARTSAGTPRTRARAAITHVVIHSLQGHYANAIETWRTGRRNVGPHYVISHQGEITQVAGELHLAQHAGTANAYSVGIEHDGFANDPRHLTEAMYASSAALTRDICQRHGIPMDRTRIIGHDEVPGSTHGDPGGYWDWEYYLALVRWGGDPATRPIRVVVDYTSYSFWPTADSWATVDRGAVRHAPHPKHSYGPKYYRARGSPVADEPAVFIADVPADGTYALSTWWPVLPGNNPDVTMSVRVGATLAPVASYRVAQNTLAGRSRRTIALPHTPIWFPLGTLALQRGTMVQVEVSRRSRSAAWIVADAIRLLRT